MSLLDTENYKRSNIPSIPTHKRVEHLFLNFLNIYLSESNFALVFEVWSLPLEVLVRLVPDDEDDVGWDLVRRLVSLPLEGYLRSRLPARLDVDGEHLLLLLRRPVRTHHPSRDLHPLCYTLKHKLVNVLQFSYFVRNLREAAKKFRPLRPLYITSRLKNTTLPTDNII